jgi:hypothetical protein
MSEVYWNRQDVMRILGLKKSSLQFFDDEGAPSYDNDKGGYPAKEYCQFIVSRPRKCKDKTNIRELAQKYLMSLGEDVSTIEKEEDMVVIEPKRRGRPKKVKEAPLVATAQKMDALQAALERARQAEIKAYELYELSLAKTGVISVISLESWQKTLDILRRCETDFNKVLERRRVLVERKDVQNFLEPMIENVKSVLLNLPAKVAPGLEGLPWHEIQSRLDQEIRDILEGLYNYD